MDLYFAPMSYSLASRVALYESNQAAGFHAVTLATKTLADGSDYRVVNPKGQVPALRLDDGSILTEGAAVLQYIADRAPDSGLAPPWGSAERYALQTWLSYIGSEIHKQIYFTIFNPASPDEARAFAREVAAPSKYDFLAAHLADREFLVGDCFTVADAYLSVTLNWAQPAGIDLSPWPAVTAYHARHLARPAVARALADDLAARTGV